MITIIYYMDGDLSTLEFDNEAEMNEWVSEWGRECLHIIVRGTDYRLEEHT